MIDTKMTGTAGEHWVCSVLARLGWAPALTRDGLARTDILAVDTLSKERRMIEVQVKTATGDGPHTSWPLGTKSQQHAQSGQEWFVLVALPETEHQAPRSFIVPRDHVAAAAWIRHRHWLTEPGIPKGQRTAPIDRARVGIESWTRYENRWDLLRADTDKAPVLLPPRMRELALEERVGLPPGHPWTERLPNW